MEKPPIASRRPSIHKTSSSKESRDNYLNTMKTQLRSRVPDSPNSDDAPSNDASFDSEDIDDLDNISGEITQPRKKAKKQDRVSSDEKNESPKTKVGTPKTDTSNSSSHGNSKKVRKPTKPYKDSQSCEKGSSFCPKGLIPVISVCIILCAVYFRSGLLQNLPYSSFNGVESENLDKERRIELVKGELGNIKSTYKNQAKDLWREAYIGITNMIREPTKPSIILLLGNTTDPLACLATLFGNISRRALNSEGLSLTPSHFPSNMGTVIESLRSKLEEKKVVIIQDLLNINVEALKAFHNLCDRINPLVKEVIFIITVISDDYDGQGKPIKFVEEELYKKLKGKMKEDAIQPLITRITDGPILTVRPEPSVTSCPSPSI